jgi:hypothetical protein
MASTDLSIYRGDDKTWNLNFTDANGSPIDLTNSVIYFTVKKKTGDLDASAYIAKDITSHSQATGGISAITITDTDSDIAVGTYYYDIQLVDSVGIVTTITTGNFLVLRDITIRTTT